jgi:hypothetical protein
MNPLRHLGTILLLLLSCAAPIMACFAPDAQMTAEERACCRMMQNHCDQLAMPASHDCCLKAPIAIPEAALQSTKLKFRLEATTAVWATSLNASQANNASQSWTQDSEHWPPKSPPAAIDILRI